MDDAKMKEILTKYRRIAVIGLSPDPSKASHDVTDYMISQGYDITGIHPGVREILGRPCYPKIEEAQGPFEIINVFRKPEAIPGVVDEIEKLIQKLPKDQAPKVLWLQLGISHPEAEKKAEKLGLSVISNRCILREHRRLI